MTEAASRRLSLRADCGSCFGLCCVGPAFAASADFAISKAAGEPCPNLREDFRCGIHRELRQRGFPGCTVFDCFGAGQKVSQITFGGRDWRATPDRRMFPVLGIMRQLHELLWYLNEALALRPTGPLHANLRGAYDETERLTLGTPDEVVALDVAAHRQRVNALLVATSEQVRAAAGYRGPDRRGADFIGKDLRRTDLRGANLRGAYLVGAVLAGADLSWADLTGADLRGADLRGADLARALFLTESQLTAATGDRATMVPAGLRRPAHWSR